MRVMTRAPVDPARAPGTVPGRPGPHGFLPFLTPVRGHAFAAAPPGGAPVRHGAAARLQREADNPADPLAVAVWATGDGTAWRIGYLERAVAARVAPRLDIGVEVTATLAGWWDEPRGRWQRPVVALQPAGAPRVRASGAPSRVWSRPPTSTVRPVRQAQPRRRPTRGA